MAHYLGPRDRQSSGHRAAWLCGAGLALALIPTMPAAARTAQDYVDTAQQYLGKGDLRAAQIELRNALRESPNDATLHLRLASVYLAMGQSADAEREARTAGTLGSNEAEYLPTMMDALLRQGKFGELLNRVAAGTRESGIESKVRDARGAAYLGLRDRDQAMANFREAVRLDPESAVAQTLLARALITNGELDEADRIIDALLAKQPRDPAALEVKGQLLSARGDADAALRKYNEVIEIDPKRLMARLGRANIYLSRQDVANADKDLDPILKAQPTLPGANYLRAFELAQRKDYAGAEQILTKISPAFPDMIDGYFLMGLVQYQRGELELAENNLTKFVARMPGNVKASRLLATIAMRRRAPARAVDYLTRLRAAAPPDSTTLTMLGDAYMADGKPEKAMAQYEEAAQLAPDNARIQTQLALTQIGTGKGQQGLALLEQVFDTEKGAAVAGPTLVLNELRAGNAAKAADVAQELVAKDKNNLVFQNLLALVRFAQNDYKSAGDILKAILARDPDFYPATQNLAVIEIRNGHPDEAKKIYETHLQRKPDDVRAMMALADLAISTGDWKAATAAVNRARTAAPNDLAPPLKLVELYLRQENYRDAKSLTEELLIRFPKNPDVLAARGRVQLVSGDNAGAVATYRQAFEVNPGAEAIRNGFLHALSITKDFKTMRDVLTAALDREPANIAIKADLIQVDAQIDGPEAGLTKAHEFLAKDPSNAVAYKVAAVNILERANRVPEAIALLETVAGPDAPRAVTLVLARLYERASQPDKAEALLKARLDREPGDVDIRLALGQHYLLTKQYDLARAIYERLAVDAPSSAVALNNIAWLDQQKGDIGKAREMAERAVALAPQNPMIADTLGWILVAQGDNDGALKYLKTANASSSDPDIGYHLAVALTRTGQAADAKALLEHILAAGTAFTTKPDAEKLLQELKKS